MIDIRKLKELVRLMVSSDLTELDVRDEHEQVTIKRANPNAAPVVMAPIHHVAHPAAMPGHAARSGVCTSRLGTGRRTCRAVATGPVIESPMVGTFYTAAGPGKPVFVQVGSKVHADSIVCLIEAMKIFNEIKAETSGTIEAILAKNGQAVEFGQPLFRIKPD